MSALIDRSTPGRIHVTLTGTGRPHTLVREPVLESVPPEHRHTRARGPGLNVPALGTLGPEALRELAAILLDEAVSMEAARIARDTAALFPDTERADLERALRAFVHAYEGEGDFDADLATAVEEARDVLRGIDGP